jgi:hypothetical protein
MNAGCLFDNKAATVEQILEEWGNDEQTILVAEREIGYERSSRLFVVGSGTGYEKSFDATEVVADGYHFVERRYTQDTGNGHTNRNKKLTVVNAITVKGGKVIDPGNGIGVNEKRRVWVMK